MVRMVAVKDATQTIITGHGISFPDRVEIAPGIFIEPTTPTLDLERAAEGCESFRDYAAVLTMNELATFSLEIDELSGGKALAVKSWNALWQFSLLSLACASPCFSLYALSRGVDERYSVANRNLIIKPLAEIAVATSEQIKWAQIHQGSFNSLIAGPRFVSAMRYYNNAHYLFDHEARIMLLWAGIESLLDVDGELSRRLALYAALMLDGTAEEKFVCFAEVKRAYAVRSQVVHGSKLSGKKLNEGYHLASLVLARLLAKCVELGRVPNSMELDTLSVSQSVQ